jgi:Zn-dependent protease with chaperone function
MSLAAMLRPGMRGYLVPLVSGVTLFACGFLPWVVIEDVPLMGFPDTLALWVMGLGALAAVLAILSMVTRRNSRHPLFIVGLAALGILFLSWRIVPGSVDRRVLSRAQAIAIVDNTELITPPHALAGIGIYVGLVASCLIVAFGFTIIFKQVSRPYAPSDPNDDVE